MPYDAKGLLKSAIRNNNPVLFLESEMTYNDKMEIPVGEYLVPIGKGSDRGTGQNVTLIAHGRMPNSVRQVVREMAKKGVSVN